MLIVVGGDGAVTRVVNGLGQAGFPEGVTLAILPTGTGNDLASTLAIPEDYAGAEDAIRANRVRRLDVMRARSEEAGEQFVVNVATGGIGAQTTERADGEMKERWGKTRVPSSLAGGGPRVRSPQGDSNPRRRGAQGQRG